MSAITQAVVVLLLLLASAAALSTALSRTRAVQRALNRRSDMVADARIGIPAVEQRGISAMEPINTRVRDFFAFGLKYHWGMEASAILLLGLALASAAASWALFHTFLHFPAWLIVPVSLIGGMLAPRQILKRQQDNAEKRFMDLFPVSLDMIVRMVRAGLTMKGAIRAVGNEAPPPINKIFTYLADQVEIGIVFTDALAATGDRIGMPDFRFFAVAISLQDSTGGNIAATLEILSDIVRKRRLARLKAKATTGEVRVSAYVLGSLPFVVITGLLIMSPAYLAPLITDPRGNAIVGAAIVMMILGFGTMRQMMRSATRF